jgi:hypothetical protein
MRGLIQQADGLTGCEGMPERRSLFDRGCVHTEAVDLTAKRARKAVDSPIQLGIAKADRCAENRASD